MVCIIVYIYINIRLNNLCFLSNLHANNAVALIIQAPRSGTTVCHTHLHLDAKFAFHCDRSYVCTQILGAYIIS